MNPKVLRDLLGDVKAYLAGHVEVLQADYDISDDGGDYDRLKEVQALLTRLDRAILLTDEQCQT